MTTMEWDVPSINYQIISQLPVYHYFVEPWPLKWKALTAPVTGHKKRVQKKKKSRIWLPVTVKSLELISCPDQIPLLIPYAFNWQTSDSRQSFDLTLKDSTESRFATNPPQICSFDIFSVSDAYSLLFQPRWTHFAPKQRKQTFVFIIQLNPSWVSRVQPIVVFLVFFTIWPHPNVENHTQITKKRSLSQTKNVFANTPPGDAKLFKMF